MSRIFCQWQVCLFVRLTCPIELRLLLHLRSALGYLPCRWLLHSFSHFGFHLDSNLGSQCVPCFFHTPFETVSVEVWLSIIPYQTPYPILPFYVKCPCFLWMCQPMRTVINCPLYASVSTNDLVVPSTKSLTRWCSVINVRATGSSLSCISHGESIYTLIRRGLKRLLLSQDILLKLFPNTFLNLSTFALVNGQSKFQWSSPIVNVPFCKQLQTSRRGFWQTLWKCSFESHENCLLEFRLHSWELIFTSSPCCTGNLAVLKLILSIEYPWVTRNYLVLDVSPHD